MRTYTPRAAAVLASVFLLSACGGVRPTLFVNPQFNFSFVEKVAVFPFENFSGDQQAGVRATRLFITELLASGAVEVVEPGQVAEAVNRVAGIGPTPSTEQIVALGKSLGVQALLLGSVNQAENVRAGTVMVPVITLDVHLVETETGAAVWAATRTEKGSGFGAQVLGTGGEPISETMRRCVRKMVRSLVR